MAKEEKVNYSALWMWGRSSPRRVVFLLRVAWRLWCASRRRVRSERQIDGSIPSVVAVSPTMRCNYNCVGCYSRDRGSDDELSTDELDGLFTEAEELGVLAIVVTGGEPLLRDDTLNLIARHRRLLFVPITNGSLVTPETARRIAQSGNVLLLVSIEGFPSDTDERRQPDAHDTAIRALECLHDARAFFGFAATNTAANTDNLGTDAFVDQMVALGCAVGFFIEYVPCGPDPRPDWALDGAARAKFHQRVLDFRHRKPILLSQFPHDEYGEENRCSGAGRVSLHINSQGDIEPCPFIPIARENICRGGLLAACQSPFLRAIRENPFLLQRRYFACSLFEHHAELEALAQQFSAHPNEAVSGSGP